MCFFVQTTSICTSYNLDYLHHRISVDFWKSWTFQFLPGSASFPAIWSDMCCVFHLCRAHTLHSLPLLYQGFPRCHHPVTSYESIRLRLWRKKSSHQKSLNSHLDLRPYRILLMKYILDLPKKILSHISTFITIPQWPACSFTETWRVPESNGKKIPDKIRFQGGWREQFGGTKRTSSLVITSTQPGPHNLVWNSCDDFRRVFFLFPFFFQGVTKNGDFFRRRCISERT